MAIALSSIVVQSNDSICTEVDGETVMMSIEKGNYYGMNEIGSRIWQLAAEPINVRQLRQKLLEEFAVDQETCEADLLKFLGKLEEHNLIQVHS